MAILLKVVRLLRESPRIGSEKDDPEGVRYVQISDTLANQLAKEIEDYISMSDDPSSRCPICGVSMDDRLEHFGLVGRKQEE